jgi:hypothetical protein
MKKTTTAKKSPAKKVMKKYQEGGKTEDTVGKTVVKDRTDKEGIAKERAKGNTVYIPKPKPKTMKKGGTMKSYKKGGKK